jgi:transposase-like protein
MTDTQQQAVAACKEKARTASELADLLGVSKRYVYALAQQGVLKNDTERHTCARYIAASEPKQPPRHLKWRAKEEILQVPSIWHYAERLK